MNWGYKITIVIILYLGGILWMVYYASLQSNEMVDDHYYEKEMHYQEIINAQQNLMNISPLTLIAQNKDEVIITFPAGSYEKLDKGTIELLRNDSKKKDKQVAIEINGTNRQSIFKSSLSKGMYTVRIKWTNDDKEYYREENIFVD